MNFIDFHYIYPINAQSIIKTYRFLINTTHFNTRVSLSESCLYAELTSQLNVIDYYMQLLQLEH
jgi:hypothetical protein